MQGNGHNFISLKVENFDFRIGDINKEAKIWYKRNSGKKYIKQRILSLLLKGFY